jgi:hypothetical protein
MLAEQMERCRQGLYLNCDELYVCGHICKHLFNIKPVDEPRDTTRKDGHLANHLEE